jgi:hypothetical protein
MAKSKSTNTLPPRDVIGERLEAQRRAIWRAQGICSLASSAGHHFHAGSESPAEFATNVWTALEGVTEMLNGIAGALEPDTLLQPKTAEEIAQDAADEEAQP